MTRARFFSFLCNFQAGILSNKEAILCRGTLKELRSKISTMLKIHCVKCFSRNLAKIYKATILKNFFRCMRSKSLTGGLLEPFMLVVTKGHTYLNKPRSFG